MKQSVRLPLLYGGVGDGSGPLSVCWSCWDVISAGLHQTPGLSGWPLGSQKGDGGGGGSCDVGPAEVWSPAKRLEWDLRLNPVVLTDGREAVWNLERSRTGRWQWFLTYFWCGGEWNMRKMKHFRRADVFISLGKPSHQKCGIFSANLRKYYCLVYKNECICLMIDRSICGLGGLCGASVGGRDGYDSLHACETFLFCPPLLKKEKK